MAIEPREQFVLQLLEGNWNDSNTFSETPTLIYGHRDTPPTKPYIAVMQPDEGPIGGGNTGFDGIDPTGGAPHQTISGTVPVHLFASDDELSGATTSAAKVWLTGSAADNGTVSGGAIEEVYRIVRANAVRPSNPTTGNKPVELLSASAFSPVPEPDEPGTYHYVGNLNYIYWTA